MRPLGRAASHRPASVTHWLSEIRRLPAAHPSIFRNPLTVLGSGHNTPMASALTRTTRVPHTDKRPERCPNCGSTAVTRKGMRKKKIEIVQLWHCASCKRVFTPAPEALRNRTYPLHVVLDAITLYDLGYSLEQVAEKIRSRFGRRAGHSTIAAWLAEYRSLTTYARLRAEGRRLFPPTLAIRSIKLYHRQIYKYAYHRPKLAMLRQGREHARFAGVADFLERVPTDCPHELFRDSERASQKAAGFLDTSRLIVVEKENAATRMAALVIPTVGDNRLRHEALQRFMLANDSTTLAIEVPIWLAPISPRLSTSTASACCRRAAAPGASPGTSTSCR